jgi:hypothetical protein
MKSPGEADGNLVSFVAKTTLNDARFWTVIGTFGGLSTPIAMDPVLFEGGDTGYRAVSVVVAKGEMHLYKIGADNQYDVDSINPQRSVSPSGHLWSRFLLMAIFSRLYSTLGR